MPETLFTVEELAEYLGVPVGTISRWTYIGVGPRAIKVGKYRRFTDSDVQAWLAAGGTETAA